MTKVFDLDSEAKSIATGGKADLFYSYGKSRPGRLVADLSGRARDLTPGLDVRHGYVIGGHPAKEALRGVTSTTNPFVGLHKALSGGKALRVAPGVEAAANAPRVDVAEAAALDMATLFGALDKSDAEMIFGALAERWIANTCFLSSLDAIYSDPALESLLRLGPTAVRHALRYFEGDPERWHHVLVELTGAQPLGSDVSRDQAYDIWSEYVDQAQL